MGMDPQIVHKTTFTARGNPFEGRLQPHATPQSQQPRRPHAASGDGAREAKPEPERLGPRFEGARIVEPDSNGGPPAGSVDLCALNYPAADAESWGQGTRLQDVAATVDAAKLMLAEVIGEQLGEHLNELENALEKKIAAVDQRLTAMEAENAALRASASDARGQIAALLELQGDLERQVRHARAVRGGDAARLPTLTVKPKIRPKRKRAAEQDGAAAREQKI
jgi:hypothetical protein